MDTEQQARLYFLSEAEEYFNSLESLLMDLDERGAEPDLLDTAMRSAHSLKGGAAMMRYTPLSKIAHRLEDFLKILRVRRDDSLLDREVTTLLLQGVDCMRTVRDRDRQQDTVDEVWLTQNADPIFARLRERLGDLKEEDEDLLLAEEEQVDVSSLIFQSGVEDCLELFREQIELLEPAELKEELETQTEQLADLGLMSQIGPFTELCRAVQQQIAVTPLNEIKSLAWEALKLWERSQALILVGRIDKLPTQLGAASAQAQSELASFDDVFSPQQSSIDAAVASTALDFLEADFSSENPASDTLENLQFDELFDNADHTVTADGKLELSERSPAADSVELDPLAAEATEESELKDLFDELDPASNPASAAPAFEAVDLDQFEVDAAELSDLNDVFADLDDSSISLPETAAETESEAVDLDQFEVDAAELSELNDVFASVEQPEPTAETRATASLTGNIASKSRTEQGRMIRIPAEQLQRLNELSSRLILERNAAMLRFSQLQEFVGLTRQRMRRLEQSSDRLRQLYDWTALERMLPSAKSEGESNDLAWESAPNSKLTEFDALEMDRYSDLHLLSQEQMETIVQLQEVTTDIDLGVQEVGQVIRNFSYTSRELQQTVTRTQMRPFAELVGRFPRLMRDLSSQHDKQVDLVIEGKSTLLDRQAIEYLGDPLNHLLRNAFDHGLEDSATRIAAGKSATGKIVLRAEQKGDRIVITVADDGGGIDTKKIRDRLLKLGLSAAEVAQVSEIDILDAIFEPGFSTAEQVTELSGRGVGMDVVRSNLQQIRGNIRVQTELGRGTTFTITVPLSLLVLRVVIVESGGMIFAVPVPSIKEITEYEGDGATRQQESTIWNGNSIDLIKPQQYLMFTRPSKPFEMPGNAKIDRPTVLVFEDEESTRGIYLDKYWNEQEVAIRTVNTSIPLFPGFTGSTILGDGRVIPLIEPSSFCAGILKQRRATLANLNASTCFDLPTTPMPTSDISTILVVDDSINVRRYLAGILERNGYQVEEAKDGRDAVDKLRGGLSVKAVICDVEMPRLDGYGVLSEIKSESKFDNLPIAMLTSRSNDKHRKLAMKLGAAAYFSKPFNEQEMLQTLSSLIESHALFS